MKYLLLIPGVLLLLILIAVVRTLLSPKKTSDYKPQEDEQESLRLAKKLSKMIQVDTTSHTGGDDPEKFRAFHKTLAELFPLVFSKLEKTEIDGNLLFYWKGRSSEKPILLMSHQDVVPAEGEWSHAPFSGDIADGKVWGRGASDTKCSVMAFFEAVEQLLAEGFTPPTDVYLASSCTEEWAGDARRSWSPNSSAAASSCFCSAMRAAALSPSRSAASPATLPWSAYLKRARPT